MNLGKELARRAKKHKICEDWYQRLKGLSTKKDMIEMYLKGIDFCLANDYPSNDFIRENFKGEMEAFGIFLDDQIDLINPIKVVALGETRGTAKYTGFHCGELFIKHSSRINIETSGATFVMVDVFDNSDLFIRASDSSKVCVNRYGDACISTYISTLETGEAVVKIIDKHKKTY